ncbi:MAG: twin-arginine translocase TatA/TatE family subunit [Pseudomonadales bacterium]|nr:twin-arginine translocase TatA/TatE family subunit [Pseudomonadales bacterium]
MSFGPLEIGLILVIVLLVFGGKKLKSLGSDLGHAIKGFRATMGAEQSTNNAESPAQDSGESKPKSND